MLHLVEARKDERYVQPAVARELIEADREPEPHRRVPDDMDGLEVELAEDSMRHGQVAARRIELNDLDRVLGEMA